MHPIRSALPTVLALALAAGLLAACNEHESAAQTRADVAAAERSNAGKVDEARADAAKVRAEAEHNLAEAADKAQAEMAQQQAEAMKDVSDADYKVMLASGKAEYAVEIERCDAAPQNERASCKQMAEANYDMVKAEAQNGRDRVRTEAQHLEH